MKRMERMIEKDNKKGKNLLTKGMREKDIKNNIRRISKKIWMEIKKRSEEGKDGKRREKRDSDIKVRKKVEKEL